MTSVQGQLGRNGSRHDIQEPLGATVPGATYKDREDVHARHEFSLAIGSLGGVPTDLFGVPLGNKRPTYPKMCVQRATRSAC